MTSIQTPVKPNTKPIEDQYNAYIKFIQWPYNRYTTSIEIQHEKVSQGTFKNLRGQIFLTINPRILNSYYI